MNIFPCSLSLMFQSIRFGISQWYAMQAIWQILFCRINDSLWSTKTKVHWFLARPSLSWAVYEPSSSWESGSNSISTRPLALSKFILQRCRKANKCYWRQRSSAHNQADHPTCGLTSTVYMAFCSKRMQHESECKWSEVTSALWR